MTRSVAEDLPCTLVVDHAHEPNMIEFRCWKRGEAKLPHLFEYGPREGVRNGNAWASGHSHNVREGQGLGTGEVEDATDFRHESEANRLHDIVFVDDLDHRVEAHDGGYGVQSQKVRSCIAHAAKNVHGPKDNRVRLGPAPKEALRKHVDLDEVANITEVLAAEEGSFLG